MCDLFGRWQVAVEIGKQHLRVTVGGTYVLGGTLLRRIVAHSSLWQLQDVTVEVGSCDCVSVRDASLEAGKTRLQAT